MANEKSKKNLQKILDPKNNKNTTNSSTQTD